MSETAPSSPTFRLNIEGEMTIYRAASLKTEILSALNDHPCVEADLSAVTDIDSAGLQLLHLAQREADKLGHIFHVTTSSHSVISLINAFNLPQLLACPPVHSSAAEIEVEDEAEAEIEAESGPTTEIGEAQHG